MGTFMLGNPVHYYLSISIDKQQQKGRTMDFRRLDCAHTGRTKKERPALIKAGVPLFFFLKPGYLLPAPDRDGTIF